MQPLNILLLEDNAGDISIITQDLKEGNIAKFIGVVNNGLQEIKFLHKKGQYLDVFSTDVVQLNINLHKLNGLEFLEKIKTDEQLIDLPVFVLSTSSSEEDISKSYKSYADVFITKTTDGNNFVKVIDAIKNIWKSNREILKNI